MKELTFVLTLQDANKIFEALGQLPYVQVHQLIHSLQAQAEAQLSASSAGSSSTADNRPTL